MNPIKKGPTVSHLGGRVGGGVRGEVATLRAQAVDGIMAALGQRLVWSNGEGDARTWADVMKIVALSPVGPSIVPRYLPEGTGRMSVPSGVWDLRRAMMGSDAIGSASADVMVEDGGVLKDVRYLLGANLHFAAGPLSTSPKFTWTPGPPGNVTVLFCLFGGGFTNESSVPIIRVPDGNNPLIIAAMLGGGIYPGASPAVSLGPGAGLYTFALNSTTGPVLPDNSVISDDNTSLIIHWHSGSFQGFPNLPGFLGAQVNAPFGLEGGAGPTVARPIGLGSDVAPGTTYYDTDLDKPIVVNNTNVWVDYAGAPV